MGIRVLIVDDSVFMRNILQRMLEKYDDIEIVGIAKNGQQGVEMVAELKPDVVTMDIEMPVMDGLTALGHIMRHTPTPVIMVSSLTEDGADATLRALELGAVDFMPKAIDDQARTILHAGQVLREKIIATKTVDLRKINTFKPASQPAPTPQPKPAVAAVTGGGKKTLVAIGSSTGGPRALQELLGALPADLPVPVVIAQHMPANFTAAMATRMNEKCAVTIKEAAHGDVLQAGTAYIAPGGQHMRVHYKNDTFVVSVDEDKGESMYKPSVDVMAESLVATGLAKRFVAIMLTGMGHDGAEQFARLQAGGSYVIAQDESSCVVFGMSRAVIEKGAADETLPLGEIAPRLIALVKGKS